VDVRVLWEHSAAWMAVEILDGELEETSDSNAITVMLAMLRRWDAPVVVGWAAIFGVHFGGLEGGMYACQGGGKGDEA